MPQNVQTKGRVLSVITGIKEITGVETVLKATETNELKSVLMLTKSDGSREDWKSDDAGRAQVNEPNIDITLSAHRDALKGAGDRDFTTLEADVESIDGKIPADPAREGGNLATIATKIDELEDALASVGTDKLLTTPDNPSNLDVALSTRASESTLSTINGKIRSPVDDVFPKDVSVGSGAAVQLDTDTQVRDAITMLADSANTDDILIGNSASQTFPLAAGASLTLRKCSLSQIYAIAASGTQTLHIIAGGI